MDCHSRDDSGQHELLGLYSRLLCLQCRVFKSFLSDPKNMENLKSEFFIPLMVDKLINNGTATCEVLDTTSKWFGVTYPEDRQSVVDKIQALVDAGEYPAKLF